MNTSDAGTPVHQRHARRHLAAVAIGLGALLGGAGVASARPIHDAVRVAPSAPTVDWRKVAELLPGSMVHERNAMLDGTSLAENPGSAGNRAVRIERGDAKDHPGYGGSTTVRRPVTRPLWLS